MVGIGVGTLSWVLLISPYFNEPGRAMRVENHLRAGQTSQFVAFHIALHETHYPFARHERIKP